MTGDHYFSDRPTSRFEPRTVRVRLGGQEVEVTTAAGVFSPEHLDTGTAVLLDTVPEPPATGHLLDLGCGWGPIALDLARRSPEATVWAVDVNERALDLVRANAAQLHMSNIIAAKPEDVPHDARFAAIWANPPIRVGKDTLHAILRTWLPRLEPGGEAHLVVAKQLGADSLQRWLAAELGEEAQVTRRRTDKGFRVLRVVSPA
ncbi:MAG TPA: methyltransferase [Microbacteriaceae bacterium]|nr:methyltransferase [Microbacteriaceae bacterium]